METLKKIVRNQYFPAAAVLIAVLLFWVAGLLGGLSMLNDDNPPIATLTWMLFVYMAAVLTPLAGVMAAIDLVRRWRRNRRHAQGQRADGEAALDAPIHAPIHGGTVPDTMQVGPAQEDLVQDTTVHDQPVHDQPAHDEIVQDKPAHEEIVQDKPARNQLAQTRPAQTKPARKKAA